MTTSPASVGPAPDGLLPCPFCGGPGEQTPHAECPDMIIVGCADGDCAGAMVAYDFVSFETAAAHWNTRAPHPDREAEPTPDGPQLCNVCNGFVPTWGVKVCQCEYHAPAGMHPAEPTGGVDGDLIERLGRRSQGGSWVKLSYDEADRVLQALSVSPPVVEGSLQAQAPSVPTEGHEAAVVADDRLLWFLRVIDGAGGEAPAGDGYNVLGVFCDDRGDRDDDTYNLSESRGWTRTMHSGWGDGCATVEITDAGRAVLWDAEGKMRRHQPTTPGEQGEEGA